MIKRLWSLVSALAGYGGQDIFDEVGRTQEREHFASEHSSPTSVANIGLFQHRDSRRSYPRKIHSRKNSRSKLHHRKRHRKHSNSQKHLQPRHYGYSDYEAEWEGDSSSDEDDYPRGRKARKRRKHNHCTSSKTKDGREGRKMVGNWKRQNAPYYQRKKLEREWQKRMYSNNGDDTESEIECSSNISKAAIQTRATLQTTTTSLQNMRQASRVPASKPSSKPKAKAKPRTTKMHTESGTLDNEPIASRIRSRIAPKEPISEPQPEPVASSWVARKPAPEPNRQPKQQSTQKSVSTPPIPSYHSQSRTKNMRTISVTLDNEPIAARIRSRIAKKEKDAENVIGSNVYCVEVADEAALEKLRIKSLSASKDFKTNTAQSSTEKKPPPTTVSPLIGKRVEVKNTILDYQKRGKVGTIIRQTRIDRLRMQCDDGTCFNVGIDSVIFLFDEGRYNRSYFAVGQRVCVRKTYLRESLRGKSGTIVANRVRKHHCVFDVRLDHNGRCIGFHHTSLEAL